MRDTGLSDDEAIEGASLTICVYYTSPALQTNAPTPISPQRAVMENLFSPFEGLWAYYRDSLFFAPPWDEDRQFLSGSSSISPSLGANNIDEPSNYAQLSTNWPLTLNRFNDPDGAEGVDRGGINIAASPAHERNNKKRHSSTDLALKKGDSKVREPKQTDLRRDASSSSSNSSKGSVYESKPGGEVKTRTRRPRQKPIMKGPNPHGRSGKPRCELCRSQRQGVRSCHPSQ